MAAHQMNENWPYDRFAVFYDQYWAARSLEFTSMVKCLLGDRPRPRTHILDLACGTGRVSKWLTMMGYQVTGVDLSRVMLKLAVENAPEAHFVQADIRSFQLAPVYSAAICLYDSLNHILSLPELTSVFKCVQEVLLPGGRFVFDLNMREGFIARWNKPFSIRKPDHTIACDANFDECSGLATMTVRVWENRRQGAEEIILRERCYTTDELDHALREAGLFLQEVHDAATGIGPAHVGRSFFAATKPNAT